MNKITQLAHRIAHRAQHPLVLHLRRRRFLHGERQLGQAELAALAGISVRQLRTYETSTRLPRAVVSLLAVAVALGVHMEDIVADRTLREIRESIARRRKLLQCIRCRSKQ